MQTVPGAALYGTSIRHLCAKLSGQGWRVPRCMPYARSADFRLRPLTAASAERNQDARLRQLAVDWLERCMYDSIATYHRQHPCDILASEVVVSYM